ncbi:hypothetical protein [Falsiroseomonas sp.]|uniref:hypothetical protein n=1 Tax=Falsiroseomonas sp. TaxID=2870721 RepID=UPI003567F0CF
MLTSATLGKTFALARSAWLLFLLLATAVLAAAFLLHPPTDWMVFNVAPALAGTVATGFAAAYARDAALRLGCAAFTALCLLWMGTVVWPAARDLGYVPPAIEVEAVWATGSARGKGYGWRGREGLTEYVCSMTIFGLSPDMPAKWSATGVDAFRHAPEARLPRWWSGSGPFSSWASRPNATEGLPPQLRSVHSRSDNGECGVGGEDWVHALNHAWRSGNTLIGVSPDAVMLLVLDPRTPHAVLIRYREYCVLDTTPSRRHPSNC